MLDFPAWRSKQIGFAELVDGLTVDDLRTLTNEMIDTMLELVADCEDADVIFQPVDPGAEDPYADDAAEVHMAWTLGHVIVHATASAEESAFLAAEMARGVPNHGRSRWELPWESVITMAQCRARLEESRRMRLATLELWPQTPMLDLSYQPWPSAPEINAVGRFVLGLSHDHDHLGQIAEIVRQARAARGQSTLQDEANLT